MTSHGNVNKENKNTEASWKSTFLSSPLIHRIANAFRLIFNVSTVIFLVILALRYKNYIYHPLVTIVALIGATIGFKTNLGDTSTLDAQAWYIVVFRTSGAFNKAFFGLFLVTYAFYLLDENAFGNIE
jgi:hypothetical protein